MKNAIFFLLLSSFALLAYQCEKKDLPGPGPGAEFSCDESPATCELTAANGDFAIALFKQLHSEEVDKNIFISPFSISTALTMTTNGANGQTLDDMRSTLKIQDFEMAQVNESYKQLLDILPDLDPQTKLKLANSIWHQIDYPVLEEFLQLNASYFSSEVIPIEFKDSGVVEQVNKWVDENTDGLIKDAISELPPNVVMLLINTIYFKGSWQTEFDPEDTKEADFFTYGDGPVKVDMMHLEENDFPYFSNEFFQAIDLPYGDSIFSMTVLLPNEGHTVSDIIAEMSPETWDQWLNSFQTQGVELFLPKFKMKYDKKLKRTLSDMGMELPFTDFADFSKMINGGGVKIDEVIHKAFVEVNEEGTEAAAVTVVVIVETSMPIIPVVEVNRPFLYIIRDNKTNSILFMGKMINPKA